MTDKDPPVGITPQDFWFRVLFAIGALFLLGLVGLGVWIGKHV